MPVSTDVGYTELNHCYSERDNIKKVNPNKILLTSGASEGVSHVMSALISDKDVGVSLVDQGVLL